MLFTMKGAYENHYENHMPTALTAAADAMAAGEVPVGAVVVAADGRIVAVAENQMHRSKDPTAHAEMIALREACRVLDASRLEDCDLWVTLEPCAMCAGAIAHARIRRLYFAALDEKSGGVLHGAKVFQHPQCHHKPEIYDGIMADESSQLLKKFFAERRQK